MNSKNPLPEPLVPRTISGWKPVIFPFSVSMGVLFLLNISLTPTYQCSNYLLLSMAWLTYFLGSVMSLLSTMRSIKPFGRISARFIDQVTYVTLVASFTTLILALPELFSALTDFNELSHTEFGLAIQSALICIAFARLYKLIRETFTSFHHKYLNVAFLNLSIGFTGLYAVPLCYSPSAILCNSFIYQTEWLYHVALIPITFIFGTILLILGVVPDVDLRLPFVSAISKEDLTVSTLAVGLITLLTGTFAMIYVAVVKLAMSGFGVGGLAEQ